MLKPEVSRDVAGISYFSLLAIFPAMIILLSLVDTFLGWMHLHDTVIESIVSLFPGSRKFLQSNLNDLAKPASASVLTCIVLVIWSFSWMPAK